jgi:hypothetical protein
MKTILIGHFYFLVGVRKVALNGRKVKVLAKDGADYRCELVDAQPGDKKVVLVTADNLLPCDETPSTENGGPREKPSEKIIDRLKKLMAMAERKEGNEAEAAVAAQMAENLMRKYNIDNADLIRDELRAGGRVVAKVAMKDSDWTGERYPFWLRMLAPHIADLFDCESALVKAEGHHPVTGERCITSAFFGYELDCEIAVWTFETVAGEVNRLADKRWEENKEMVAEANEEERVAAKMERRHAELTSGKAYKSSFRRAAANVVCERILQLLKEKAEELAKGPQADRSMALVVIKKEAIEEQFGKFSYEKTKFGYADQLGAAHGKIDGQNISLNRPVTAQTDNTRLLK